MVQRFMTFLKSEFCVLQENDQCTLEAEKLQKKSVQSISGQPVNIVACNIELKLEHSKENHSIPANKLLELF